jgi:hypothetical protein
MSRRTLVVASLCLLGLLAFLFTPTGVAVSQQVSQVIVTNFPGVQRVNGEVEIRNPVRLAQLVTFPDIIVSPVHPSETTRLVEAGTLQTEGFPRVVLSLHGVVKGEVLKSGEVGAILIPDQPTIAEAFNEQGMIQFDLRAYARGVSSATPYFASNQPEYTVGFQAYKIYLYNTTDKTVTANLFAYLTN